MNLPPLYDLEATMEILGGNTCTQLGKCKELEEQMLHISSTELLQDNKKTELQSQSSDQLVKEKLLFSLQCYKSINIRQYSTNITVCVQIAFEMIGYVDVPVLN